MYNVVPVPGRSESHYVVISHLRFIPWGKVNSQKVGGVKVEGVKDAFWILSTLN